MGFLELLRFSFSSLFYGVIATAATMTILFFLLKSLSNGITRSIAFYVTGVVLALLLVSNFSLLIGAAQAKSYTKAMEITLSQLIENCSGVVSTNESQQIFDILVDKYPLLGNYLQVADFGGNDISDLPQLMSTTIRKELNSFIWSRVWWSLGFIVLACVIAMLFDKGGRSRTTYQSFDDDPFSDTGYVGNNEF